MNSRVIEGFLITANIYLLGLFMFYMGQSVIGIQMEKSVSTFIYGMLILSSVIMAVVLSAPTKPVETKSLNPHNSQVKKRRGRGKKTRDTMGSKGEKPPDFPKDSEEFLPAEAR